MVSWQHTLIQTLISVSLLILGKKSHDDDDVLQVVHETDQIQNHTIQEEQKLSNGSKYPNLPTKGEQNNTYSNIKKELEDKVMILK